VLDPLGTFLLFLFVKDILEKFVIKNENRKTQK